MGRTKWSLLAGLGMMATVLAPSVFAGLEVLPTSSHYWGMRQDGNVRIEFAVYDTQGNNEFASAGFAAPGDGRYTYVYQLFNTSASSEFDIEYFQVNMGLGAVTSQEQIGSADDLAGGIASTDAYFDTTMTKGAWEFEDASLVVGKHSAFLIISSDQDWVVGQYSLTQSSDFPVPGGDPNVPEPMTLMLMAAGGLGLLSRRNVRS